MNDSESPISITEHLSAMLDDEAGSFEERRVLDELKSDKAMSQKLATYALIGETMRTGDANQSVLASTSSFLNGIHEKIATEEQFDDVILDTEVNTNQVALNNTSTKSTSVLRPIGGFALAASVGALAFMSLQNVGFINLPSVEPSNIVDSSAPTAIANNDSSLQIDNNVAVQESAALVSNADQYVDADAETRSMLKRYVDSHMQYASSSTFVPSVRVIAYTDNQ